MVRASSASGTVSGGSYVTMGGLVGLESGRRQLLDGQRQGQLRAELLPELWWPGRCELRFHAGQPGFR
ncbi:hypothetical protein ACU4GD_39660 [Cupriavidus basilensis]